MRTLEEVFKPKWELGRFEHFEDARSFAIANGWRENPQKIQIRQESPTHWVVEPFEKDCGCPKVVRPY